MPKLIHIQWDVNYTPGTLLAKGYKDGKEVMTAAVETTGEPNSIRLIPDRDSIKADGEDVSVITVQVEDDEGRIVPTAGNEISFNLKGQGKIIGVGNGNPSSHEQEKFLNTIKLEMIGDLKMALIDEKQDFPQTAFNFDDSKWPVFKQATEVNTPKTDKLIAVRGYFKLPVVTDDIKVTLFTKSICDNQSIFVNGHLVTSGIKRNAPNQEVKLDHSILRPGKNIYTAVGTPFVVRRQWEQLNADPGIVQVIIPAERWKRRVFNGLAQIIVQSQKESGELLLTAESPGLKSATVKIETQPTLLRPAVPAK